MWNAGAQARGDRMRYRRPSRLRRVAKWVGLGMCVVILCLWVASFWFIIVCGAGPVLTHGQVIIRPLIRGGGSFIMKPYSDLPGYVWPRTWWRRSGLVWPRTWGPIPGRRGIIPLWMPFCTIAIPTAILWRRDQRPRKGHCLHCGYNLTGNESGVCPECATPVPPETQ